MTYQYNGLDQMVLADLPGGKVVEQGYTGDGQPAWSRTTVNGAVTAADFLLHDGPFVVGGRRRITTGRTTLGSAASVFPSD